MSPERTNMSKQVWRLNLYERPMCFWDYYDLLDDYKKIEPAFRVAKEEEMIGDSVEVRAISLICADLYRHYEKSSLYQQKNTIRFIKKLGGYSFFSVDSGPKLLNKCIRLMKEELHDKDFVKLRNWLNSERQKVDFKVKNLTKMSRKKSK